MFTDPEDDFQVALSTLLSDSMEFCSGDTSLAGITRTAIDRFARVVQSDAAAGTLTGEQLQSLFDEFAVEVTSSSTSAVKRMIRISEFEEFCEAFASQVNEPANDILHTFCVSVLQGAFRVLAVDVTLAPVLQPDRERDMDSSQHSDTIPEPRSRAASRYSSPYVRKEDFREYLETTLCSDGKALIGLHDFAQLMRECRHGDLSFDDFASILVVVLRGRIISEELLMTSIEESRAKRREAKRHAMEKLKAEIMIHESAAAGRSDASGDSSRDSMSPSRKRALSPYAFGSWKANSGAVNLIVPQTQSSKTVTPPPTSPAPGQGSNTRSTTNNGAGLPPTYTEVPKLPPPPAKGSGPSEKPSNVAHPPVASANSAPANKKSSSGLDQTVSSSYDFDAHSQALDEAFALLDVNEANGISLDAIYEFCAAFPAPPPQNAVRRIFLLVDANASNDIDREEFEQLCFLLQQKCALTVTEMCSFFTNAMYRRLFELCDEDGTGIDFVSREVLRSLLEALSPILNLSVGAADTHRWTKEFATDRLNFDQFQSVVKQFIRGRSISKVVAAFEEVLRRRRLLKRQALERFAPTSVIQPSSHTRKVPPPPPPPQSCSQCLEKDKRIKELSDEVALLKAMLEKLESQRDSSLRAEQERLAHTLCDVRRHGGFSFDFPVFSGFDAAAAQQVATAYFQGSDSNEPVFGELLPLRRLTLLLFDDADDAKGAATYWHVLSRPDAYLPSKLALLPRLLPPPVASAVPAWLDSSLIPLLNTLNDAQREWHRIVVEKLAPKQTAWFSALGLWVTGVRRVVAGASPGYPLQTSEKETIQAHSDELFSCRSDACSAWETPTDPFDTDGSPGVTPVAVVAHVVQLRHLVAAIAQALWHRYANNVSQRPPTPRQDGSPTRHSPHDSPRPAGSSGTPRNHRPNTAPLRQGSFQFTPSSVLPSLDGLNSFIEATAQLVTFAASWRTAVNENETVVDAAAASLLHPQCLVPSEQKLDGLWDACNSYVSTIRPLVSEFVWTERSLALSRTAEQLKEFLQNVSSAASSSSASCIVTRDKSIMVNLLPPPAATAPTDNGTSHVVIADDAAHSQLHLNGHRAASVPRTVATSALVMHSTPRRDDDAIQNRSSSPRVRSRRERPADVRQHIDALLVDFLPLWKHRIPDNFERADPATNIFHFGSRKIELSSVEDFITVKVGGGYLTLYEFCEKHGLLEIRRLAAIRERQQLINGSKTSPLRGSPRRAQRVDPVINDALTPLQRLAALKKQATPRHAS